MLVFDGKCVSLHSITIIGLTWKSKTSVEDGIDGWYRCHDILEGVYLTLIFDLPNLANSKSCQRKATVDAPGCVFSHPFMYLS